MALETIISVPMGGNPRRSFRLVRANDGRFAAEIWAKVGVSQKERIREAYGFSIASAVRKCFKDSDRGETMLHYLREVKGIE